MDKETKAEIGKRLRAKREAARIHQRTAQRALFSQSALFGKCRVGRFCVQSGHAYDGLQDSFLQQR